MRIKKESKSVGIVGKILNLFSDSKEDTYSCDYINNQIETFQLKLENGIGLMEGTRNISYYNTITKQVTITGVFTNLQTGVWTPLTKLPEKYRPKSKIYLECASGIARAMLIIEADGLVRYWIESSASDNIRVCGSYYTF